MGLRRRDRVRAPISGQLQGHWSLNVIEIWQVETMDDQWPSGQKKRHVTYKGSALAQPIVTTGTADMKL